jgi:hypothetical protein
MSERGNEIKNGSRREFLRGVGMAASGITSIGMDPTASAQTPNAGEALAVGSERLIRASTPSVTHLSQLGPLRELSGTWVGRGFNLISLPDFDNPHGPQPFRLNLNATREILEFTHIGGNVPNRGSQGQSDINIFGLMYLQRISDAQTNGALHIEPGLWLHVPASTVPSQPPSVVRQGSMPCGTSVLAQGAVIPTVAGGPVFHAVDSTPFTAAGPITNPGYLAAFSDPPLPPAFKPAFVKNPNLALSEEIQGQTISKTTVLSVSTLKGGGLLNIPFVVANAHATQLDAVFWIETVQQLDGSEFMQLQYTQTVILSFLGISWPHISVATLVKQ